MYSCVKCPVKPVGIAMHKDIKIAGKISILYGENVTTVDDV